MSKIKIGDKVKITVASFSPSMNGKTGVIRDIDEMDYRARYKVITDKGYLVWCAEVEHVKEKHPVIVITTDGKTTTATMRQGKTVLKTASARCGKRDSFDFAEGARIAFERLQGREPFPPEEKPELTARIVSCEAWPKKVLCIRSTVSWFKPGLVYKVIDLHGLHVIRDRERYVPNVPWPLDRDGDLFKVGGDNVGTLGTFAPITED